ncbi:hypothetical protein SAMD00023378_2772 [Ralstonia sp. NT80]|nr:hypothetical protein SAMD00023378_2772 [Ralstonia sp. NT80]
MPNTKHPICAFASKLGTPPITKFLRAIHCKKAATPHSHQFSLRWLALEIYRQYEVLVDAKTVARQLRRLGLYAPWSQRPKGDLCRAEQKAR